MAEKMDTHEVVGWLRSALHGYRLEPVGMLTETRELDSPVYAADFLALRIQLEERGVLFPLPSESASFANVVEESVAGVVLREAAQKGVRVVRGKDRGYPDLEFLPSTRSGEVFAVDIKVARKKRYRRAPKDGGSTESRITLYTGNTYFRYPKIKFDLSLRPFAEYSGHISIIVLYTLDEGSLSRSRDFEVCIHPTWMPASTKVSSTTRVYIGAVKKLDNIRRRLGEFETEEAFYKFWRDYPFPVPREADRKLKST